MKPRHPQQPFIQPTSPNGFNNFLNSPTTTQHMNNSLQMGMVRSPTTQNYSQGISPIYSPHKPMGQASAPTNFMNLRNSQSSKNQFNDSDQGRNLQMYRPEDWVVNRSKNNSVQLMAQNPIKPNIELPRMETQLKRPSGPASINNFFSQSHFQANTGSNSWQSIDNQRLTPFANHQQAVNQFKDVDLQRLLHLCSGLDSVRQLWRDQRVNEVAMAFHSTIRQVQEVNMLTVQQQTQMYMQLFQQHQQCGEVAGGYQVKDLNINLLLELSEILGDVLAKIMGQNMKVPFLTDLVELSFKIKTAIDKNLEENEFQGVSEEQQRLIQCRTSSKLFTNLSCYYSQYLLDQQTSQAYAQRATQAETEIYQLNLQMGQVNHQSVNESISRFSNNSEAMTSMAISLNNQAVIELKQKNPEQAIKLSEQSVSMLESNVFRAINQVQDEQELNLLKVDFIFTQQLQSLLIAYFNLGMAKDMIMQVYGTGSDDQTLKIFQQALDLAQNYFTGDSMLHKKLQFKVHKLSQKRQERIQHQTMQKPLMYGLDSPLQFTAIHSDKGLQIPPHMLSPHHLMQSIDNINSPLQIQQTPYLQAQILNPNQSSIHNSSSKADQQIFPALNLELMKNGLPTSKNVGTNRANGNDDSATQKHKRDREEKSRLDEEREKEEERIRIQRMEEERIHREEEEKKAMELKRLEEVRRQEEVRRLEEMKRQEEEKRKAEKMAKEIKKKQEEEEREKRNNEMIQKLMKEQQESMRRQMEHIEQLNLRASQEMQTRYEQMIQSLQQQLDTKHKEQQATRTQIEHSLLLTKQSEETLRHQLDTQKRELKRIQEEKDREEQHRKELELDRIRQEMIEQEKQRRIMEQHNRDKENYQMMQEKFRKEMQQEMENQRRKMEDELRRQREELQTQHQQLINENKKLKQEQEEKKAYLDRSNNIKHTESPSRQSQQEALGHMSFANQINDSKSFSNAQKMFYSTDINLLSPIKKEDQDIPIDPKIGNPPFQQSNSSLSQPLSIQSPPKTNTVSKINLNINEIKESSIGQLVDEEQRMHDASNAFLNNNEQIRREIDIKQKIVVTKIVYSQGAYHKFSVVARSYSCACKEIPNCLGSYASDGFSKQLQLPFFQLIGSSQDNEYQPTTLSYYELFSILKIILTPEVIPSYVSIGNIRCFQDLCRYLIFPFVQLDLPRKKADNSISDDHESIDNGSCSQVSQNFSNMSNTTKPVIEMWGRAPGLLTRSFVFESFLGDVTNVGIHYVENRNFRISLTSLEKETKGLNSLFLDLIVDEVSFETLFKPQDPTEFKVNQNGGRYSDNLCDSLRADEVFLQSIEVLSLDFVRILEPGLRAYEDFLQNEFGRDVTFDQIILDRRNMITEIRIQDAMEDQDPRLQLWTVNDSSEGGGKFVVQCRTMYKIRIKKRVETELTKKFEFEYKDFQKLFGVRKSEVERPILIVFCERLLRSLTLFMPTINIQNQGKEEDSDKEEEVYIKQINVSTICYARQFVDADSVHGDGEKKLVTAELLGVNHETFLGIRVQQFNKQKLSQEGIFLFLDQQKWALSNQDKEELGISKLKQRKSKKEALVCYYWLAQTLYDRAFAYIFQKVKFDEQGTLIWETYAASEEQKVIRVKTDILEDHCLPDKDMESQNKLIKKFE